MNYDVMAGIQTPKLKSILESYSSGIFNQNPPFLDCTALKSEALRSFEKSVIIYLISQKTLSFQYFMFQERFLSLGLGLWSQIFDWMKKM